MSDRHDDNLFILLAVLLALAAVIGFAAVSGSDGPDSIPLPTAPVTPDE